MSLREVIIEGIAGWAITWLVTMMSKVIEREASALHTIHIKLFYRLKKRKEKKTMTSSKPHTYSTKTYTQRNGCRDFSEWNVWLLSCLQWPNLSSPAHSTGSHNDHHSKSPSMVVGPDMNFMWDPRLMKFTSANFTNDPFYLDRIEPLRWIGNLRKGALSLCKRLRKAVAAST